MKISKKTSDRISEGLKKYQRIVNKLRERDISEADTVTVIKDILTDLFGYDKYTEITSEHQIRNTFCDLAIQIDGKIKYLAEAKSAGTNLNDNHIRQVVNYGANLGIEWVILTNAIEWRVYRIKFSQPIDFIEVFNFDITQLSSRSPSDMEKLYMLTKESVSTNAMVEFHRQAQIFNRFVISEIIQSDSVTNSIRKEFKRLFPTVKVNEGDIHRLLTNGVLKRDTIEGDFAIEAKSTVKKATNLLARKVAKLQKEKAESA